MAAVDLLVYGSVAAAVTAWALARILGSRALWTSAVVLMVLHSIAAFITVYDGSHVIAETATRQQTAALTGIEFGGGIYINYVFLLVWAADVTWWWVAPRSYVLRPRWVSWSVHGFIFFIILNGAVIFADGWARVLGAVSVASVIAGAWHRYDRSDIGRRPGAWHRYDRSDNSGAGRWDTNDTGAENIEPSHFSRSK
jgi:hypothetical protein